MNTFEAAGNTGGSALRFAPADDGATLVVVRFLDTRYSVILDPSWLLPVAAWFAGEAQPVALGDRPGTLYGRRVDVFGDERATVWNERTWARLDCVLPFGTARIVAGPRGRASGVTVMLTPQARQDVAVHLRRLNAALAA